MENYDQDKLRRARRRVDELKGFYIHFVIYLAVNAFIMVNIFIRSLEDGESFWRFGTFATAFFWGIGVAFHASKVFNLNPFLGKKWEERQIQKYIDKDKEEAEKYQ
ncbi:hypothetical protein GTQ38_06280 [Flavobacteriaceae bacterium R33]|uniref:2TM domain-containing protein n=2 Tax=Poritiphilus flavus TaxID=2697053 RepID=A0A6L9EA81_9FLAO|nr:hypothetical protein [Poritiphilus flavus]